MADVRALLKAKRQEVRINHPLASYTANGQLRCLACGTIVKQTSSWEGHVGSKAHRTNAARLREEEQKRDMQEQEERLREKRRASEMDTDDDEEPETEAKRARTDDDSRTASPQPTSRGESGFPADFFSDGRAPPPPPSDDEDEEQVPATAAPPSAIDLEWQKFQESVLNNPDEQDTYDRATVMAEPVINVESGFPEGMLDVAEGVKEPAVVDEAELRRLKEQESRELIMDRLLDEERAQEEADAKVTVLKNRLETLKKQREAARKLKGKSAQK